MLQTTSSTTKSGFFALQVTNVAKTIRDAVVVTLQPSAEDKSEFDFTQGQYLTFRKEFDGEELRRSYSICSGKDDGELRVAIKRVDGGVFSSWANDNLKPGDHLEAMAPAGNFFTELDATTHRNYLALAVGSGITPVLSLIKTMLKREPNSTFTLVYGNRSVNTIMFREELEDLKNYYMGRFNVIHVLNSDAQDIDLFTGRIDAEKCDALFASWVDVPSMDTAFICGPEDMMKTVSLKLEEHGLSKKQIKFELFGAGQPGRAKRKAEIAEKTGGKSVYAKVTLDGTTRSVEVLPGQSVLEAAAAANMEAPFACKGGVCSTCKAKLLEGEVEMEANYALEDYEVEAGYILTCQSHPLTPNIVIDYDA